MTLFRRILGYAKTEKTLILILFLAAFFRLYDVGGYMEFLGDQGRDMVIVRDFLKNGNLFFIGPQTSIGNMYLGPFYYYLIAPSLLLSGYNPTGPSIFIAILSILTVFLIYKISNKWFSKNTAIIASILYSISPVVIKYSNFSWNPNVMPLFSLLFVYFMVEGLTQKKYLYFIYASLSYIMAINSHYLALLLLPLAAVLWFIHLFKTKKISKEFFTFTIYAIVIFVISLTPQILFDLKHQNQNLNALVKFFTNRETTVNLKAYKTLPSLIPLTNQINSRLLLGKNETLSLPLTVFIFVGSFLVFFKKNTKRTYFVALFLWLLFGIGGLGLYKQHIYDHYFGFIFPVPFIIVGIVLSSLFEFNRLTKIVGSALLLILVYLSVLETPIQYPPNNQLQTTQTIVKSILAESNNQPFNFALLAKQNYDPPYRYYFSEYNSQIYLLQDKITDQLFVVCEPWQIDCQPINNPEWNIAAFGWAKIDKQWQINGITIFKLTHNVPKN
ncbi:MAG: glycosyltransferase family 39 protein [Candidatus Shapirobacteria bacterium]|jgi:4-amino-4-deoxy-L-arabinose transferase-like glycosyltransferase